jgi:hypothetical protein
MSNHRSHALLFSLLAATGTGAFAETPLTQAAEQRFDHRQDRQAQRINNGVASGALTAPETRRLDREQGRLNRAETRAEADGKITPREAASLEKRQDVASRRIFRQKHDVQTRHP